MNNLTYIGDNLLKSAEFLAELSERFSSAGGVKAGEPVAYFEIGDKRYIYIAYAISLPSSMISSDKDIVDVFEGLLASSRAVYIDGGNIEKGEYIALRWVEAIEKNGRINFYIRAVQV